MARCHISEMLPTISYDDEAPASEEFIHWDCCVGIMGKASGCVPSTSKGKCTEYGKWGSTLHFSHA